MTGRYAVVVIMVDVERGGMCSLHVFSPGFVQLACDLYERLRE